MLQASFVVLAHAAAAVLLSWLYFRRFSMTRPPIGVFNLADIAIMIGAVILVPFLYLLLPLWMVAGLLTLGAISILYFTLEPVLRSVWAIWLVTLLLAGADLVTALAPGIDQSWFFAVNNAILVVAVVGATNLWAQSGMQARAAAILGVTLATYDVIATSLLPLMDNLFARVAGLPFAPMLAWPMDAGGQWLGIGLGDLVLAAVFPLVMRKAFGRTAGIVAVTIGLGAIGVLTMSVILGLLVGSFPVMFVLGPLMAFEYAYWRRRQAQERTTWQYLQAEPIP